MRDKKVCHYKNFACSLININVSMGPAGVFSEGMPVGFLLPYTVPLVLGSNSVKQAADR